MPVHAWFHLFGFVTLFVSHLSLAFNFALRNTLGMSSVSPTLSRAVKVPPLVVVPANGETVYSQWSHKSLNSNLNYRLMCSFLKVFHHLCCSVCVLVWMFLSITLCFITLSLCLRVCAPANRRMSLPMTHWRRKRLTRSAESIGKIFDFAPNSVLQMLNSSRCNVI